MMGVMSIETAERLKMEGKLVSVCIVVAECSFSLQIILSTFTQANINAAYVFYLRCLLIYQSGSTISVLSSSKSTSLVHASRIYLSYPVMI